MDDGSKLEKYTGYTPLIKTGKEKGSAPVESTEQKGESPVLRNAPTTDGLLNSEVEVSASDILAIQVMMGDFRALKEVLPKSRQASSRGKIYWCAEISGHALNIVDGILLVDNQPADRVIEKLLAVEE